MMSMFAKTTSPMARTRTPRSTLSEDSDDLSAWEIIDNHLSDDDDVYSFDGDDSMCDGPVDLVAMLSDGDGGAIIEVADAAPNQLDCYGDVDEEGACETRDLVPVLTAFLTDGGGVISEELDSVSDQLELGDCSGNGYGDVDEEGACESRDVVPVLTGFVAFDGDLTGDECFSRYVFPVPVVSTSLSAEEMERFVYGDGYGVEEDDDVEEEEDDLDDGDYEEEELMMFKFDGRVGGRQRMKKTGKKVASKSKMAKSKKLPYSFNRPGCIYKKAQHAYL